VKKFLLVLLILMLLFGGYLLYNNKFEEKIPVLELEEEVINIDELFIYGTHLNIHGNTVNDSNLKLVLYNGEFIEKDINIIDNSFNLSDYVNDGLYLDDIPVGNYYMFLRSESLNEEDETVYKYYALNNTTDYKETIYYTFSNFNNKIVINSEDSYPTMMMNISENKDNDIYDIVIDPGHGGIDGGAGNNGYSESDFTLKIANKLKKKLEEYGFRVKLTHEEGQLSMSEKLKDYGVNGRASIPYEVNAKYLFSIHMNSNYYEYVNGLEIYTAANINYDFSKLLASNIIKSANINYSSNMINRMYDGIYTRTFTESDIADSLKDYEKDKINAYDITTKSNYYYIIRETGGIVTGAYVDDRNDEIVGNPYVLSNVGTEAYLLELGYISNKNNLNNMINNMDKYVEGIFNSISTLYNKKNIDQ